MPQESPTPVLSPVMQLLIDYDCEHPATLGEMSDRRVRYERRIHELIGQAAIDGLHRGHRSGLTEGAQVARAYPAPISDHSEHIAAILEERARA